MYDLKKTLTLEDAIRLTGPLSFNIMIKPAGSLCNLDCNYCYYLDKAEIYDGHEPRMSLDTLKKYIKAYIDANDVKEISFNWHGGEPLLMGIDFYRKALEFEHLYGKDKKIINTIQTNGTLIDYDWARFLQENGFLVGISIDGPRDIHDKYRKDKSARSTFDRVLHGVEMLYKTGAEYNTMTTINKASEGRGLEVYQFLKSIGSRYMQFMPVVEHIKYPLSSSGKENKSVRPHITCPTEEGARIAPWSVSSISFGKFLCDIFDYWVRHDVGTYFVNQFDAALAGWCGVQAGTCAYAETCGGNAIIEHNGDLYPCDHFVYRQYRLGNLHETDLRTLMTSSKQEEFGLTKRNGLPRKCLKCQFYFVCHGECPKHRFSRTESGETGLNALCDGYYNFYSHVSPYMERMRSLLNAGKAPAEIMELR